MTEHVAPDLVEYPLQLLDRERARLVDEHLRKCRSCLAKLGVINDCMVEAMIESIEETPVTSQRESILQDIGAMAPYSIFHAAMARILNVRADELIEHMQHMPHPSTWADGPIPQCRLFPYKNGPESNGAIRTLILMESGSHFPIHEHYCDEVVLILQGSLLDQNGRISRPGDVLRKAAGTSHSFDVPEGLDLIYLAVVEKRLRIGDVQVQPPLL